MSAPVLAAPTQGRRRAVVATRVIPVERERVFDFLADLENHWLLADRFIEVVGLNGDGRGGTVRIRGPLGLRRTASTSVVELAPGLVHGRAAIGRGTTGNVRWTLEQNGAGTVVTLEVEPDRLAPLDGLLLVVGGRPWLRNVFARILLRLEQRLA